MWHTVSQDGLIDPGASQVDHDEPGLGIQILQSLATNAAVDASDVHVKFVRWKRLRAVFDSLPIDKIAIDFIPKLSGQREVCDFWLWLWHCPCGDLQ